MRPKSSVVLVAALLLCLANMPSSVTAQPSVNRNVRIAQDKVNDAQQYFQRAWSDMFRSTGRQLNPPRVIPFQGRITTACGVLEPGNGAFCSRDNSIYLDAEFLAQNMMNAANALKTDGDYAAIVIAAHEFGHVVAAQLNAVSAGKEFESEQVADCFAGVITRRSKTDGLLEAGDLEEGMYSLANAGDEVGHKVGNDLAERLHFIVRMGGLSHGFVEQRQGAFLQGYYGGANLCTTKFGPPKPLPAGNAIVSMPLGPLSPTPSGAARSCVWTGGIRGLQLRNLSPRETCLGNLLNVNQTLPVNLRIELTVASLSNDFDGGIYFADGRSTGGLTRYRIVTNSVGGVEVRNENTISESIGGLRVNGMPWNLERINKRGENRLTVDIRRMGQEIYFMVFVNDYMVEFGHSHLAGLRPAILRAADQAGVAFAGVEAVFRDFRILALPD
ncbi:MAG TPA: neutral zinc metallopeptidase [Bryobacteraceae bacterium]|nr:neutral zinc metallopeptidase [Bryobacteraceae bacterium]